MKRASFSIVGGLDVDRDSASRAEARRRARPILRHWLCLVEQRVAAGALLPGDYLLARALTNFPSANFGRCWAGQERLATTLGRSTETIRRAFKRLCRSGLLAGQRGGPGRTATWTFCEAGAALFGGHVTREKTRLKEQANVPQDRSRMTGLDRSRMTDKPYEVYPSEQEPPPYPPAQAQAEPPQGGRHGGTLVVSAPLDGEVLGPEAVLTFDEFWGSIHSGRGKMGPAIAGWRSLSDDDRRAISARIGPDGLDTEGMWACVWLRERGWEREPLHLAACIDVPPASRCIELAPYSAAWLAERDRKRAAGERVELMEDQARAGKGWTVRWQ